VENPWRDALDALTHRFDNLTLTNTDGDAIAPHSDHFTLLADHDRVLRLQQRVPGAQAPHAVDGDHVIAVLRPGAEPSPTVIGQLVLSAQRLTVESQRRISDRVC